MNATGKRLVLALTAAVLSALLVGSGMLMGSYLESRSIRRALKEAWQAERLGGFTLAEKRQQMAQSYLDPGAVAGSIQDFSWAVANVPTPFVGSGPKPGARANVVINSRQFRSSRELPEEKEEGVLRVFITGGSVAFGAGAPSQDRTIGGYLERELNRTFESDRFRVYTLANPAWASTQERILIENRLSDWQPDLVISFSGLNDIHWGELGRDVMWFRTYQDQLFWSLSDTAQRAFGWGGLVDVQQVSPQPVEAALVGARLEKNIRLSDAVLRMSTARYLFVLQPSLYVTGKELTQLESSYLETEKRPYFSRCYAEIRSRLEKLGQQGLWWMDLTEVFDGVEQNVFLDHYHFADRGNQLVARRLAEAIRQPLGASPAP